MLKRILLSFFPSLIVVGLSYITYVLQINFYEKEGYSGLFVIASIVSLDSSKMFAQILFEVIRSNIRWMFLAISIFLILLASLISFVSRSNNTAKNYTQSLSKADFDKEIDSYSKQIATATRSLDSLINEREVFSGDPIKNAWRIRRVDALYKETELRLKRLSTARDKYIEESKEKIGTVENSTLINILISMMPELLSWLCVYTVVYILGRAGKTSLKNQPIPTPTNTIKTPTDSGINTCKNQEEQIKTPIINEQIEKNISQNNMSKLHTANVQKKSKRRVYKNMINGEILEKYRLELYKDDKSYTQENFSNKLKVSRRTYIDLIKSPVRKVMDATFRAAAILDEDVRKLIGQSVLLEVKSEDQA